MSAPADWITTAEGRRLRRMDGLCLSVRHVPERNPERPWRHAVSRSGDDEAAGLWGYWRTEEEAKSAAESDAQEGVA